MFSLRPLLPSFIRIYRRLRINKFYFFFAFILCIRNLAFGKLQIFVTTRKKCQNQTQIDKKSFKYIRVLKSTNYIQLIKVEFSPFFDMSCKCINSRTRQAECYYELHYQNKDLINFICHAASFFVPNVKIVYLKSNNLPGGSAGMLSSLHQKWKLYHFCKKRSQRDRSIHQLHIERPHKTAPERTHGGTVVSRLNKHS